MSRQLLLSRGRSQEFCFSSPFSFRVSNPHGTYGRTLRTIRRPKTQQRLDDTAVCIVHRARSMTTGVLCCAKHRPYRRPVPASPARIMDPQFIQLESQLAALRNQRHPMTAAAAAAVSRLTAAGEASSIRLPKSPRPRKSADPARGGGLAASSSLSSLSLPSSSSSLTLSQDVPALTAETSASSPSSSLPSSSSSVDSATAADKRDCCSLSRSQQLLTTTAAYQSSEQCQPSCVSVTQLPSSSSSSPSLTAPAAAAAARLRSIPSIHEERSRFRIVKIDTYVDRGRWHCHNFADPHLHDADVARSSAQDDLAACGARRHRDDDDDSAPPPPPPPSQIYYIAAGGQNDGDLSDLSRKFYVSTIVYGEHGHPVLDRTVHMSPLQLLRQAGDVDVTSADAADTLTPSPRANHPDSNQSPADTPVSDDTDSDTSPTATTSGSNNCRDVLPVDGHVTSAAAAETGDVTVNDLPGNNLFSGVATSAHRSMPAMMTSSSMTSEVGVDDDVSRRPVTTLPLRRQDDVEIRCQNDSSGSPANCPTLRLLSADDSHSTRCALCRVHTARSSPQLSELVAPTITPCMYSVVMLFEFAFSYIR